MNLKYHNKWTSVRVVVWARGFNNRLPSCTLNSASRLIIRSDYYINRLVLNNHYFWEAKEPKANPDKTHGSKNEPLQSAQETTAT